MELINKSLSCCWVYYRQLVRQKALISSSGEGSLRSCTGKDSAKRNMRTVRKQQQTLKQHLQIK